MNFDERTFNFACGDSQLVGVVSVAEAPAARGVLVVVGGPQYRAGSHRQFTLLARSLAARGIPVMRFDYRGMGDSEGASRDFEHIDEDIRASVDAFLNAVPAVREVVIWGLCDAASAALFYAGGDARVTGLVLLNPWVRTTGGLAKATLKHYYLERLRQPALWRKIASGKFDAIAALRSFARLVGTVLGARSTASGAAATASPEGAASTTAPVAVPDTPLPERMRAGLERFAGPVLLITCAIDLTAQEFVDATRQSRQWQRLLRAPRVTHRIVADADHTFSRRGWRDDVATWTGNWIATW